MILGGKWSIVSFIYRQKTKSLTHNPITMSQPKDTKKIDQYMATIIKENKKHGMRLLSVKRSKGVEIYRFSDPVNAKSKP